MVLLRSAKWAFILYHDSAPENYIDVLDSMHIPYAMSPWHDKDINKETGELKKPHKHGVLYFDSLKSYAQVSELLTKNLNTPAHVQPVMSPKGMYDYFIHAENPDKTLYDIKDIESGCGFQLEKFIIDNNQDAYFSKAVDIINTQNFVEFSDFVNYARANDPILLKVIVQRSYFFARLIDSIRYNKYQHEQKIRKLKALDELEEQYNLKKINAKRKDEEIER